MDYITAREFALNYSEKGFYSQFGQDKYFFEYIFKNQPKGFFVDIGAHDGVTINNTYYLEKKLNWKGIAVEANP